jgi:hypothetical protein
MKKSGVIPSMFVLIISAGLYSCGCSCTCEKNLGCKILVARDASTGDTIEIKTFCSTTNFHTDKILNDSVQAFYNRSYVYGGLAIVTPRDSIYKFDSFDDLNCNQTKPYSDNNYSCLCAK